MTAVAYRYLLDTNTISALARQPQGSVAMRIRELGEDTICTSIIVACELRFGLLKRGSPRLSERVEAILDVLSVLPLEPPGDVDYAAIRHALETAGTPVGPNDLLIAAQARSLGLTVVTDNIREFSRVPGLSVESWDTPNSA